MVPQRAWGNVNPAAEARKRWLGSRQPGFAEAFDGGYDAGIESAWAAAEQLINDCMLTLQAAELPPPSGEGILEAFAEARHDLPATVAKLDRRFKSSEGGAA